MRWFLCSLALCSLVSAGDEDKAKPPLARALPDGCRLKDLGPCDATANGRIPCAIAEANGRVVVAFPEAGTGRLCLCTNLYRPPGWRGEKVEEYWDSTAVPSFDDGRLAALDMTTAMGAWLVTWAPLAEKYDPQWTESVGGPGRWQTFCNDPQAPPMLLFPAFAIAHAGERSVYVVHNDPKSKALNYLSHPGEIRCLPALPVGQKEEIVALAVQANGAIHGLTFLDGKLSYLTNKGGEPKREVLETGDLAEVRGAVIADETGAAHVVCRHSRSGGLSYRTNQSGEWVSTMVERGTRVGMACALALDPKGRAHVCYTADDGVRYATNADGWKVYCVGSGKALPGCDIAVDGHGCVHICYVLGGRMTYATNSKPREEEQPKEGGR